jgi:hypothetical protein
VFRKSKLSKALSTVRLKLEDLLWLPAGLHCRGRRHQGERTSTPKGGTGHRAPNWRCDTFFSSFYFLLPLKIFTFKTRNTTMDNWHNIWDLFQKNPERSTQVEE